MAEAGFSNTHDGIQRRDKRLDTLRTPTRPECEITAGNGEWATSAEYKYYQGVQNETHVSNTSEGKLCYEGRGKKSVEEATLTLRFAKLLITESSSLQTRQAGLIK